jgi:6-phosphogluconolactonase
MTDIRIFDSPEKLYREAAEIFLGAAAAALREKGLFSVALAGGGTPLPLYQWLAENPLADQLAWDKAHFFWGDERTVGPDHPDSNYRGALHALLLPREVPPQNIHRIEGERLPEAAAKAYQEGLMEWFGNTPPRFDLILLGMGDDGHTASLFPGTKLVETPKSDQLSWIEAVEVPQLDTWRITFTPRLINNASQVLFLVRGSDKAQALKAVLEGPYLPTTYPAQLVQPENGQLVWLVDQDAAADLRY